MKDFVYLPPMWWFQYGVGAYVAFVEHVLAYIPRPVLNEDTEQ